MLENVYNIYVASIATNVIDIDYVKKWTTSLSEDLAI